MSMNRKSESAASWAEQQKEFYQVFPHGHLQFNLESIYAQNIVNQILPSIHLSGLVRILEVGCGSGRFTLHLARKEFSLSALDISPQMLENLRDEAYQLVLKPGQLTLQLGDIGEAQTLFRGQKFDKIIGFFFLHHLEDVTMAIKSVSPLLREHGEMMFIEPNRLNPLFIAQLLFCADMTWKGEKGTFRYGVRDYRRCFEDCEYTEVKITKFGFFPPQVLDLLPWMIHVEKWLEKIPGLNFFLPFLFITARRRHEKGE